VLLAAIQLARGLAQTPRSEGEATAPLPLQQIPPSRRREMLEEMLLGPRADAALQWLHDTGLLAELLPEVEATVDFTQEMDRRHKDVWKHTKQVVTQASTEPTIRWAALLHDIGKVPTRAVADNGKVTFHGHAEVGARMFDRVARRLAFPKPLRTEVRFLILHHLRANQYDGSWTDSAVRRFDREMGDHLEALLGLSRADITSARRHKREAALAQIEELAQRIRALQEIDSRKPPLPSGLGNQIMERFGLDPGRIIGQLRRQLEQAVEAGELEPFREPEYYLDYLDRVGIPDASPK
jgi:poly(A) polymerase